MSCQSPFRTYNLRELAKIRKMSKIECKESGVPSFPSRNGFFVITVKNYTEAVFKGFSSCPALLIFFHSARNILSRIANINKCLFITCPSLFQISIFFSFLRFQSLSQAFNTNIKCSRLWKTSKTKSFL